MSSGGLNIAALARRTGVAPDTLRKWEQRYEILRPRRTSGGQRRYSEVDVARVEWLTARLAEGYRIGEAAALLGPGPEPGESGATSRTPEEQLEAAFAAAQASDVEAVTRTLDQAFALHPLAETLERVVAPLLRRVGDAWQAEELTVAQEHLVSAAVRARIERLLSDARGGVRGAAVLACAPGERHELGLLMLAVLLRADGWQVAYLGADLPVTEAFALADLLKARAVCLSVTMGEHAARLAQALDATARPESATVFAGGAAAGAPELEARGIAHLNHDLASAVAELRALADAG
ncbi:MAG: MerR family transcriptional regulator, light-induced transcriptional regulator [Gaiellaceae bacterium]|nr:MerR family transcriptional regulator, light-induced transcriptional regulator [Gaiellaceae bacterium]